MGNSLVDSPPLKRAIQVKVTKVDDGGLHVVLLEDGRSGFIREREITWERRIGKRVALPKEGEILAAVSIEETSDGKLFLSLRQITDPWEEALKGKKYPIGKSVEGEVVNVRHFGAFIQVEPGVDAIVYPRDVLRLPEQSIEDVLFVGDKVVATVTGIDQEKRLLEVDIIKRLREIERLGDKRETFIRQYVGNFQSFDSRHSTRPEGEASNSPFDAVLAQNVNLPETIRGILLWLGRQIDCQRSLLVELDELKQAITVTASHPPLTRDELEVSNGELFFSPVHQVITQNQELVLNEIDFTSDKFKNFFSSLDFSCCLGVPIRIADQETRRALIVLFEDEGALLEYQPAGRERLLYGRMASYLVGLAIEKFELFETMRKYQERYLLGQLLDDLIHEAGNKITTSHGDIATLKRLTATRPHPGDSRSLDEWLAKLENVTNNIETANSEFWKLIESYTRQIKYDYESVDVNQIVVGIGNSLGKTQQEMGACLVLDVFPNLPFAWGLKFQIQQAVLNLVLNALYMFKQKREEIKKMGEETGREPLLLDEGLVIVQTRYEKEDPTCPIRIRVIDNGPGIHYRDQQMLFRTRFSRRGGAGLGLSISRNLIERMGGHLVLSNSILFVGSAFEIQLRPARPS